MPAHLRLKSKRSIASFDFVWTMLASIPLWFSDFVLWTMLAVSYDDAGSVIFFKQNSPSKKYDILVIFWFCMNDARSIIWWCWQRHNFHTSSIIFFIQNLVSNQLYVWIPAQKSDFVLMLLQAYYFITIILYYLLTKCNPPVALCTPFNPSPCSHYCTFSSTLPCICCFSLSLVW